MSHPAEGKYIVEKKANRSTLERHPEFAASPDPALRRPFRLPYLDENILNHALVRAANSLDAVGGKDEKDIIARQLFRILAVLALADAKGV
jgi:hypothetical protein